MNKLPPLKSFTAEDDLENMKKNKDLFIKKMGKATYDLHLSQLEEYIANKAKQEKKGKYICLEGSEGVGKTTQVRLLVEYLKSKGHTVFETKEPGTIHSPLTMKLRGLVLDSKFDSEAGYSLLKSELQNILDSNDSEMTFSASQMLSSALISLESSNKMNLTSREYITQAIRNIHLIGVVSPALKSHDFVVQDRGILSGLSYGGASGVEESFMHPLNTLSVKEADLGQSWDECYSQVIVLKGNVAAGLKRAQAAKQEFVAGDVMESRGTNFLDKVNDNFTQLAKFFPNLSEIVVDGKSIDEVFSEIKKVLLVC